MKLFKTIAAAGVMSGLLIGAASAGSMEARYGNTVVVTYADATTKVYYNADHTLTFTVEPKDGAAMASKGTWHTEGVNNICITPEASFGPFTADKESCVPLAGDKVGDSWLAKVTDGQGVEQVTNMTIVAGR